MGKIKLTKGELKRQRDSLRQYERYLPTLQLKKQQLQLEILHQAGLLETKIRMLKSKEHAAGPWLGFLAEPAFDITPYLIPIDIAEDTKNIAGVDIPVFLRADFNNAEYDLFLVPLWVDAAIESLRTIV
jgi:V/A-type H+-transporting ATPase subunit D